MVGGRVEFDWLEYSVFGLMMGLSALIGVFFGFVRKGPDSVDQYLLGGRNMGLLPISASLICSYISGITIIGIPTEIYIYGTQYLATCFAYVPLGLLLAFVVIPVFYNLQLLSLYEYLEMRFDSRVRKVISFLYTIYLLLYIPIVIYGPGLALNQVSGFSVLGVTIVVSLICIFYTILGGLRAVVWTDTLQGLIMVGSILLVCIAGTSHVGGLGHVLRTAQQGDRLEFFNFDPDPRTRTTWWSMTIGVSFIHMSAGSVDPSFMQRFIALPSLRKAQWASLFFVSGGIFFLWTCGYIGLILYASYHGCDPFLNKEISRQDQILPHFILKSTEKLPGLSGIFLASVVSAALSTMSTGINTVGGTIYSDFIEPLTHRRSETEAALIIKSVSVVFGLACIALVLLVEKLGTILELTFSVLGLSTGVMMGIICLGLLVPRANSRGAITGGLLSMSFMMWLLVKSKEALASGQIVYPRKPISVLECSSNTTQLHHLNSTVPAPVSGRVFPLYEISIYYYAGLGCLLTFALGWLVSWLCPVKPWINVFLTLLINEVQANEYFSQTLYKIRVKASCVNLHTMVGGRVEFDWLEYSVFGLMMGLSALIGVFFGFVRKGPDSVDQYLLGGRNMGLLPISASLICSYISGVTIIGIPTEVYIYGTQFMTSCFAFVSLGLLLAFVVIPVFYNLHLLSLYEYLEMRFDSRVRKVISFIYTIYLLLYIPIVIYGPGLALNQVSGFSVLGVTTVVSLICIFYTISGGLRAVVWTDTLQGLIMVGSILLVCIAGTSHVGGLGHVLRTAQQGDRLEFFNFDPDPRTRTTWWSMTIGVSFIHMSTGSVNPSFMQRFIALPSLRKAQWWVSQGGDESNKIEIIKIGLAVLELLMVASLFFVSGGIFFLWTCGYIGLILYASYHGCDPFLNKEISRQDQILPHFVLKSTEKLPGLSGIFLAGVVSAALSTMSTGINTIGGTIYSDFIEPLTHRRSETEAALIIKSVSVVFGLACIALVLLVEKLGTILELTFSVLGLSTGVMMGIICLGLLVPRANSRGAITGGLLSMSFMMWLLVKSKEALASGQIVYPRKPISVLECTSNTTQLHHLNSTVPAPVSGRVFPLYEISIYYYAGLGCLLTFVLGWLVSWLCPIKGATLPRRELISPLVYSFNSEYSRVPPNEDLSELKEIAEPNNGKSHV